MCEMIKRMPWQKFTVNILLLLLDRKYFGILIISKKQDANVIYAFCALGCDSHYELICKVGKDKGLSANITLQFIEIMLIFVPKYISLLG